MYINNPFIILPMEFVYELTDGVLGIIQQALQESIESGLGDVPMFDQRRNFQLNFDITKMVQEHHEDFYDTYGEYDEIILNTQLIDDPIDVSSVIWERSSHRSWLLSKMFPTAGVTRQAFLFGENEAFEVVWSFGINGNMTPNEFLYFMNKFIESFKKKGKSWNPIERHLVELITHEYTHFLDPDPILKASKDWASMRDSRIPISKAIKRERRRTRRYISGEDKRFSDAYVNQRPERKALLNSIFYTMQFYADHDPAILGYLDVEDDQELYRKATSLFTNLKWWKDRLDPMSKLKVVRVIRAFQRKNPTYFPNLYRY